MAADNQIIVSEYCCDSCGTLTKLRCSGCQVIHYCSSQCQNDKWAEHKLSCKTKLYIGVKAYWDKKYNVIPKVVDKEHVALFARKAFKSENLVVAELSSYFVTETASNAFLRALWKRNKKKLPPFFEGMKPFISDPKEKPYIFFYQVLRQYGYYIDNLQSYIYGLATSFARHSCNPNCHITPVLESEHSKRVMFRIVALRDIEPGEEITIFRHESCVMSSYAVRRAHLKKRYGFDCECLLCLAGGEDCKNNKYRLLLADGIAHLNKLIGQNTITIDGSMPKEIDDALIMLLRLADKIYPSHEYKLNPALLNIQILVIKISHSYGHHDKRLIKGVLKQIDSLQTHDSPLYLEIKKYFSDDPDDPPLDPKYQRDLATLTI